MGTYRLHLQNAFFNKKMATTTKNHKNQVKDVFSNNWFLFFQTSTPGYFASTKFVRSSNHKNNKNPPKNKMVTTKYTNSQFVISRERERRV